VYNSLPTFRLDPELKPLKTETIIKDLATTKPCLLKQNFRGSISKIGEEISIPEVYIKI
jgi:hypothetical protein